MTLDNVPNTFQLLHTSKNFEIYFLKKTCDFQAFYKLIRHLVNLSKNLQAFLCLRKLSRDISDAPSCFRSVGKVPRLISQTSPRTLKDPRRILRILRSPRNTRGFPQTSPGSVDRREGRMYAAISHVVLIYRSERDYDR